MATTFAALYRYSRWDGKQRNISADDLMSALSDDFLYSGNIEQALKSLLKRGALLPQNQRLSGMHDMIRKLREQRQKQLQQYNLDSIIDDLRANLEDILSLEKATIADWLKEPGDKKNEAADTAENPGQNDASDRAEGNPESGEPQTSNSSTDQQPPKNYSSEVLKNIATNNRRELEQLPDDIGGQIKSLQEYEFLNPEAQEKFRELTQKLRDAMTQTFFNDVSEMVNSMSDGDLSRMKDMLGSLNDMLSKHMDGEDGGFEEFMEQFGDMFGANPPASLDDLLAQMEAQMAATQSLMNSLSADQRQQLQSLLQNKFGDPELQKELARLSNELSFLNPQPGRHKFSGEEAVDFQSAMQLMEQLQQLEKLEKQFRDVRDLADLADIDEELVQELMGDEGREDLAELKKLLDSLDKAGYIRKDGDRWQMTPRGSRVIGQKALEEIYRKLKKANIGGHRSALEGSFGDQQEDSKAYEFGDALDLHIPRTLKNALRRQFSDGAELPTEPKVTQYNDPASRQKIKLQAQDFEVHRRELNTKTSTVLLLDLSLSMALRDAFVPAKKVALALHNLISSSFPRDTLDLIGFSAYAREIKASELAAIDVDQFSMGTNMQHALDLAEKKLSRAQGGSRQIIMISDGEPTAHMEDGYPYFEYPPNPVTIAKTLLAVKRCTRKNITINTFMLDQSPYLRGFMNKIAQLNGGRIFYTTPHRLGEYILHDYVENKKKRVA